MLNTGLYFAVGAVVAVYMISCGVMCNLVSEAKGYAGGFWLGFFFGFVGLIYLGVMPMEDEKRRAIQRQKAVIGTMVSRLSDEDLKSEIVSYTPGQRPISLEIGGNRWSSGG